MEELLLFNFPPREIFKISDLDKARADFRTVFNTGLKAFLEPGDIIAACGQLMIDVVAFDKYLEKEHPEIVGTGLSFNAVIRKYYGDAGVALIDKLMVK